MRNILNLLTLLLLALSCTPSHKEQKELPYNAKNTLFIDSSCVIILQPDSAEIAKMHAQYSQTEYEEWMSGVTWYPGLAASELKEMGINTIPCHDKEYIILETAKQGKIVITRKKVEQDLILFHVNKKPHFISSSTFEENKNFILRYFDKK